MLIISKIKNIKLQQEVTIVNLKKYSLSRSVSHRAYIFQQRNTKYTQCTTVSPWSRKVLTIIAALILSCLLARTTAFIKL